MMLALLWLRARLLLWLGDRQLARMRRFDQRSAAAMARAEIWIAAARRAADRVPRSQSERGPARAGDLLHGSRAIAAFLGVRKSLAVHLIRSRQIPTFQLGGVVCARKTSLTAHLAALEAGATGGSASP